MIMNEDFCVPEIAEYGGKLTPQQQSLILSRIKALAAGNEYRSQKDQPGCSDTAISDHDSKVQYIRCSERNLLACKEFRNVCYRERPLGEKP